MGLNFASTCLTIYFAALSSANTCSIAYSKVLNYILSHLSPLNKNLSIRSLEFTFSIRQFYTDCVYSTATAIVADCTMVLDVNHSLSLVTFTNSRPLISYYRMMENSFTKTT